MNPTLSPIPKNTQQYPSTLKTLKTLMDVTKDFLFSASFSSIV